MRTVRISLLLNAVDDETTSQPCDVSGLSNLAMYLIGYGTTSGGTITYEEAVPDPVTHLPYSGTWSAIGSANNASDVSSMASDGTKQKTTHLSVGAYSHVRARISDAITGGGSVSVVLVGSE